MFATQVSMKGLCLVKDVVLDPPNQTVEKLHFTNSSLGFSNRCGSVWIMKEKTGALKAGVNWRIVNFMVDVPEKICHVFPNVFENVSWDDEE